MRSRARIFDKPTMSRWPYAMMGAAKQRRVLVVSPLPCQIRQTKKISVTYASVYVRS
jgi:hypothetical protein